MRALQPHETVVRTIVFAINQLIAGRSNSTGSVTLTAGATTTTVTPAANMNSAAKIFLTPTTANAAAEQGSGTLYVSAVTSTSFTLTHANSAQTDRTFDYDIRGG